MRAHRGVTVLPLYTAEEAFQPAAKGAILIARVV
jgi:hypothetical protein